MSFLDYSNTRDLTYWRKFEERESDWRNGACIYQIIVDRFVPAANLDAKRHLYERPKQLHDWSEEPRKGHYLHEHEVWSHELDFWGGDLQSTRSRIDYLKFLDVDVLYTTPINPAWTNHGYDGISYRGVRDEYGTMDDFRALAKDLHDNNLRLILDGVFNHLGRKSLAFQEQPNPDNASRSWFEIDPNLPDGSRNWANVRNLPELVLENPAVAKHLWSGADSVVRSWLREGADGWRLDVSYELGMYFLGKITQAAHQEKPKSLVLGEMPNWPAEWFPELDGVLNFPLREIIIRIADGRISSAQGQRMMERMFDECDFEHMLKSWVYLDNHDTARITHVLPNERERRLAIFLQFTLPGSVNLYYGTELGMTGGEEPESRAPMRWDLANDSNQTLSLYRDLIKLRREHRALRIGDLNWLVAEKLLGFERRTNRVKDSVFVIANPGKETVTETVLLANSKLMDHALLLDEFTGQRLEIMRSMVDITLEPGQVAVLTPLVEPVDGYSPYKRIH